MSKVGHGSHRSYAIGCRCDHCRIGERQYRNDIRSRKSFSEMSHGERRAYRAGCRCDLCIRANSIYGKALIARRNFEDNDFPHGRVGAKRGCRCGTCVEAKRKEERDRKRERRAHDQEYAERLRFQGRKSMSQPRAKKLHVAAVNKRRTLTVVTLEDAELVKLIYLSTPNGYTVDHIVPLAKGGRHAPENLQYLPLSVNCAKHARLNYDASKHVMRWQDIIEKPSTTISQESRPQVRPKRLTPEMEMI